MGFKNGVALFSMIVTAKPGTNVFRIRHLKTHILVASNFGNVDRDLRMASCCRKERDKYYYIDCTHDRAVHDRSPSISPHDRIPMAACPQDPGKSRGLRVLDRLVARPKYSDNWTTATLYESADERHTILADEADNLPFEDKGSLHAVCNSGYEKGGMIPRGVGKHRREWRTFAPLALASIGVLT